MKGVAPEVSVLIVHWNTPRDLEACLDALPTAAGSVGYEAIVIDNASATPLPNPAIERAGATVLRNRVNRGFAAAANRGARAASGERLLFLNPDARMRPGSLETLVRAAAARPSVAAVAADARDASGRRRFPGFRFLSAYNHALESAGFEGRRRWLPGSALGDRGPLAALPLERVDWARASTLLVDRRAFAAVGGFDEGFFLFEEDEDLCWRLKRRGYATAVCPAAVADDPGGVSTALAGPWAASALAFGQRRFLKRRLGSWAARVHRLLTGAVAVAKLWRRGRPGGLHGGAEIGLRARAPLTDAVSLRQ